MTIEVSIGQVKRDLSELVNRVAYQGERIILTSRGRRKAVLVSLEDYARLQQVEQQPAGRAVWLAQAQELAEKIRQRRGNQGIDVDGLIEAGKVEREARDER